MDFFTQLEITQQNETHKMMEISPMEGFFDFNLTPQLPYQSNEFKDLENFSFHFNLPPLDEHFESGFASSVKKEEENHQEIPLALTLPSSSSGKKNNKSSSGALEFDEIKKHFGVPITVAAKELNVGLTHLKKRCRELNIMRWPHRKLKSLKLLIDNVKELGMAKEVAMLEKHKKMLEKVPCMGLNQEIKKLRQACFKANYKRRRFMMSLQTRHSERTQ